MNYKAFILKSNEILDSMNMEELRCCLNNIAKKIPEDKRLEFLQLLDDCCFQKDQNENSNKYQYKRFERLMPDDEVKDKLTSIKNDFEKIENGELCLSAQGYEDYSGGYWLRDWVWEYEDNEGIGRIIEDAALFAQDCVNDCRYEESLGIKFAKSNIINKYLERYPKHRAFRGVLKEYMD